MKAADIADALLTRCGTLAVGSPPLPVAMPDVAFDPPASGEYLEVQDFTNEPFWQGLASGRIDQGLLRVIVVWPKGQGVIKPKAAADAVGAHFAKGTVMASGSASVRVVKEPWAASPLLDGSETRVPVTIEWRAR